jgi:small subunit ribosomal protein S1
MVNKHFPKTIDEANGGPPPQDESWWGAILAEEESRPRTTANRAPHTPAAAGEATHTPPLQNSVDWSLAQGQFDCDSVVQLQVVGHNRGGLLVNGEHLQGFVPISHLVKMPTGKTEADQEEFLASYLGQDLRLKIIECDQERGRVVFSERAALAEAGSRNLLLQRLHNADCAQGTVTNITDFGIFVDLGGVEGLIHVSEISWGRVRHPSDVVTFGESVRVYVIGVDQERARIALSLKRLTPNPWETAEERYHPGLVTDAVITSILPFGAFARLEEGLDGLIHVSEMGEDAPSPLDVFQEGQQVRVRILHVDANRQRLGLSLKLEA